MNYLLLSRASLGRGRMLNLKGKAVAESEERVKPQRPIWTEKKDWTL